MKKRFLLLALVSIVGCKTSPTKDSSDAKTESAHSSSSSSILDGVSYGLDNGDVVAYGKCPNAQQLNADDTNLHSSGCVALTRLPIATFRERFVTSYEKINGSKMSAKQLEMLNLVGSKDPLIQRKLLRYSQVYGNVVADVFGLNTPVAHMTSGHASLALDQQDIVIDLNMRTPFGSPSNSPVAYLGSRQADRIRVEVGQDDPN